jgi:hypothetical protein
MMTAVAGEKDDSTRGVSHFQSFYFVIVLLSFFTLYCLHIFIKNTKKLAPFIVGICYLIFSSFY